MPCKKKKFEKAYTESYSTAAITAVELALANSGRFIFSAGLSLHITTLTIHHIPRRKITALRTALRRIIHRARVPYRRALMTAITPTPILAVFSCVPTIPVLRAALPIPRARTREVVGAAAGAVRAYLLLEERGRAAGAEVCLAAEAAVDTR
ncbi:hypothetical protein PMIN05_006927 [Paraphaeosphaeria minitans]